MKPKSINDPFFSLILQEEEAFNYAVSIYGIDDVAAIQALVRTRTKIQVRNRTSKASLVFRVPTCWVHSAFSMHFSLFNAFSPRHS